MNKTKAQVIDWLSDNIVSCFHTGDIVYIDGYVSLDYKVCAVCIGEDGRIGTITIKNLKVI
jgi:hypothetical protein